MRIKPSNLYVLWKGQRNGPYTHEQLLELWQHGEIGAHHLVERENRLITLEDYLRPDEKRPTGPHRETTGNVWQKLREGLTTSDSNGPPDRQIWIAYTLCGLCFVIPVLFLPLLPRIAQMRKEGYEGHARILTSATLGMTLAGLLFWWILVG
jgi:hypothetical protein